MQHDAALERGQAETGDKEFPHDDCRDDPAREDPAVDQHDQHGEDEDLVRDRIE